VQWFEVDKEGLAKVLARKGKAFALFELIQNSWDTRAGRVDVTIEPIEASPFVRVRVQDDDPDGFVKMEHAFTLFAESDKKADPTKRGRFNLGEKLVLALCRVAEIVSVNGAVRFDADGRRKIQKRRDSGSEFYGEMRMTRDELAEVQAAIQTLIVPDRPQTFVNGVLLGDGHGLARRIECVLPTEIADADGYLRRTERKTVITLHEVRDGFAEVPRLYEMGIPVVELPGDRWHVNVAQKIPLNADRDNVTPAYLRAVRVAVLNATTDLLTADDAAAPWVNDAAGDDRATDEAVEKMIALRFGDKRVIADPSDPEGTKIAMSKGYTVIPGGTLSASVWENVKRSGAALPAGQVTPSPKPYTPGGRPERVIPEPEWTDDVRRFVAEAKTLSVALLEGEVAVRVVNEPGAPWVANYGIDRRARDQLRPARRAVVR
jgi:hypothetical protein